MNEIDTDFLHVVDLKAMEADLTASLAATLGKTTKTGDRMTMSDGKVRIREMHGIIMPDGTEIDIAYAVHEAMSDAFGATDHCLTMEKSDPLVEQTLIDVMERVPEIVHARRERLTQDNIDRLVDTFLKAEVTAPARAAIELDNARERARFREEVDCYTSREVAALAGHSASNASATATRWKTARRIIGLPWKDGDLYPAFQFQEGRPRPVIGQILAALPAAMTPWQIAFWLTSSNGWLDGAAPADRLGEPDAVVAAAMRESEKLIG